MKTRRLTTAQALIEFLANQHVERDGIEQRFFAPEPGDYVVWCYTRADQNNAIFEELTIPSD